MSYESPKSEPEPGSVRRMVRKTMIGTAHWAGRCDGNPALVLSYYGGADLWVWNDGWGVVMHAESLAELNKHLGISIFGAPPTELFSNAELSDSRPL